VCQTNIVEIAAVTFKFHATIRFDVIYPTSVVNVADSTILDLLANAT
jgi:hypothetical protein